MLFTYQNSRFSLLVLGIHVFAQLAAAVLIYIKHHEPNQRSWRYIFIFFVTSAIASLAEILLISNHSFTLDAYKLLDPLIIIPGFYIFALLLCYIIDLMLPKGLDLKRLFLIFTPSFIVSGVVLYFVITGNITSIYSVSRLRLLIANTDVIPRVIFLFIYLPYNLLLVVLRFKYKNKNLQKYLDALISLTILLSVSYIFSRGLQFFHAYVIHEVLYILLSISIVYAEHYERLHVPLAKVRNYYSQEQVPTSTQETVALVAQNLSRLMDDPRFWQDPDLTNDKIVHLVGTNRTYIQHAAKLLGFANLSDMLNRRRIDYVCRQLNLNPNASVQDLFYDAGYRSRTTAWRHFTTIVGCTPTEFVERDTPPPSRHYN